MRRAIGGHPWLCPILLLAFALRASTLLWGLPILPHSGQYLQDERKVYLVAAEFPENYLQNRSYIYGTAYANAVGILTWPLKATVFADSRFERLHLGLVALTCRALAVLLGTASVVWTYRLGRKLHDDRVGLLAAGMLAVAMLPTLLSAQGTLDVPMSSLLVLSLLLGWRATRRRTTRAFVVWGLVCGLLAGTKVVGGLAMGFPLLILLLERSGAPQAGARARGFGLAGLGIAVALATLVLSTPHLVLRTGEYLEFMAREQAEWVDRRQLSLSEMAAETGRSLYSALGPWLLGLATVGLFLTGRGNASVHLALIGLVLSYLAFWRGYLPTRFVVFVTPVFCILAARAVTGVFAIGKAPARALAVIAAVGTLSHAAFHTSVGIWLRWNDPRTLAAKYLHASFPEGTTIGPVTLHDSRKFMEGWRYPRIAQGRHQLASFLDSPDVVLATSWSLDAMEAALASEKLLDGEVWDERFDHEWPQHTPPSPRIFRFFDALLHDEDGDYQLEKQFTTRWRLPLGIPWDVRVYVRRDEGPRAP